MFVKLAYVHFLLYLCTKFGVLWTNVSKKGKNRRIINKKDIHNESIRIDKQNLC